MTDASSIAQLHALIRTSTAQCGSVRVIAIDGPSGSGKTDLATRLADDYHCSLLAVEDLIPGWEGLQLAPTLLTDQVLLPLSQGWPGSYRRWDWYASDWAESVAVPVVDLLIVEGCGAAVRPAGDYAAVRVWVDAPTDLRQARGLSRDGETYRPHWRRWAAQEEALFAPDRTAQRADLQIWTGP